MTIACLERALPMAERAEGDGQQPSTVTVRMDAELVRKARIVCAHNPGRQGKHLKLVDYIDSLVRAAIDRDHDQVMDRVAREREQGRGGKKGGGKS